MNRDRAVAAGVAAITLSVIGITWWEAPARHVDHVVATEPAVAVSAAQGVPPTSVREMWVHHDAGLATPIRDSNVVVLSDAHGVQGVDPYSGEKLWGYHRDIELCAAMSSEGWAVTVFRGPAGCGEVTSLNLNDGSYNATRRSIAPDRVMPLASARRSGVWSPQQVELWRGDLVRTVEFGKNPAPQEPNLQPWPECTIGDAVTRDYSLAVVGYCPEGVTRVAVQTTEPEDSRTPELSGEFTVSGPARLVGVTESAVAVYHDGQVSVFRPGGTPVQDVTIAASTDPADKAVHGDHVQTQGHTLWFTGHELVGLAQPNLRVRFQTPAIGTGDIWSDRILVPVTDGIAVVTRDGEVERTIAVPRPVDTGRVDLRVVGSMIIEWRGDTVVGLFGN